MLLTNEALDEIEHDRLTPDHEIVEILRKEVRLLLHSGDLQRIYQVSPYNTERTWLIEEISKPRIRAALRDAKDLKVAHWEYVVSAHTAAVSFALRAGDSLRDFKDQPYADEFVPVRLYYDDDDLNIRHA